MTLPWKGPFRIEQGTYIADAYEKTVCRVFEENPLVLLDILNRQAEREAAEKPVGEPVYSDKDGEVVVVKNKDGRLIATLAVGEPIFMTLMSPAKFTERVRCGECCHYEPAIEPTLRQGNCFCLPMVTMHWPYDSCDQGRRKE